MPAIGYNALEFNADDLVASLGLTLQTGSTALTAERHYLVLGSVYGRSNQNNQLFQMRFDIGGVPYARYAHTFPYGGGAISGHGGVAQSGRAMSFATTYITATGSSDVMEIYAADAAEDGSFGLGRIYALDFSGITLNDGRWHSESPNADLSGSSPTSGWTTLGSPGAGSLVFTPTRTGRHVIIASCEMTASSGAATTDEIAIRLTQNGNEVSGTLHLNDLEPAGTTSIVNYCVARAFVLTSSTEYTFSLEGNGTNSNGNIFYRRVRVHAIDGNSIENEDIVYGLDTNGETVAANADVTVSGITLPLNPSGSTRDYMLFANYAHETDFFDDGRFLIDSAVQYPPATFGFSNLQFDFGLTATDDLTSVYGHQLLRAVPSASTLQLRLHKYNGGVSDNQFGSACARAGGGDISVVAFRLYSQTPDTASVSLAAAVTGSGQLEGSFTIDSGIVRLLLTVESMQNTLNNIQNTVDSVVDSVQIVSTNVISGTTQYIFTGLNEPNEFYAGMGVIVTSGSTGVSRKIAGFNQTSGTIYFNERLPFSPVSGASVVIVEDYSAVGGFVS